MPDATLRTFLLCYYIIKTFLRTVYRMMKINIMSYICIYIVTIELDCF